MSESANTFNTLKPELKEMYSDAKKKSFTKIKDKLKDKKCKCDNKCGCKK